jgi:hypothetical protein
MAHGGARSGAGRKAGSASTKTREIADKAAEEGITPLEYMLTILRDETKDIAARFEAAKHAAPYIHPKLSSIEASGPGGTPLNQVTLFQLPDNGRGAA